MTDVGHIIEPSHIFSNYLAAMRQHPCRLEAPTSGRGRNGECSYSSERVGKAQGLRQGTSSHVHLSAVPGGGQPYPNGTNNNYGNNTLQDPRTTAYGNPLAYINSSSSDAPATLTTWPEHESSASGIWPAQAAAQPLPRRSHDTPTTPIIVTTDWSQDFSSSQPQDATYSAASPLPQANYNLYNSYPTGDMTHPYPPMPQDPNETMQTPVSPVSADNTQHDHHHHQIMGDEQQLSRKRSHSVMSQQDVSSLVPVLQHNNHSRAGSIASAGASPNDATEDFSPRGSRAFKRENPPQNSHGKFICIHAAECEGLIFERKCEWSKHMDKHDRPYRCPHPQCAKLQGFTYSGGLLRHEREVHGKHGGPKSQLMCPHSDCKRHTGKGFTRKENLNEHLRRVHPNDKESQNLARSATMLAEEGETPISKISEPADHDEFTATSPAKRKRSPPTTIDSSMMEDPEREIKRLRAEISQRDLLIQRYEQDAIQHEHTRRELEIVQQQLHHEQQHAHSLQPGQG